MAAADVPGISFAFFDRSGVRWTYVSGVKSAASTEPVGANTVFEAASISKPVFAYLIQTLVTEGSFDLNRPLTAYMDPVPEVGYDARSALLTPEVLLSHQGGLPNWRTRINLEARSLGELFRPADTLRFVATPGDGYRYSGEGFVLLQRVVETHTRRGLDALARAGVFEPLSMTRSSFSFDTRAREDYALGHARDGRPDKWGLRATLASSTLHATAGDLARFGVRLAAGLASGDLAVLADPRVDVRASDGTRLRWGLGLGLLDTPTGRYVYHGGNNVIFMADFIYAVDQDVGYVLLTNSANGQAMIDALERRVFGRALGR